MSASGTKDMLRGYRYDTGAVRRERQLSGGFSCDLSHDEFKAWCEFATTQPEIVSLVAHRGFFERPVRHPRYSGCTMTKSAEALVQAERAAFLVAKAWYEDLRKEHVVRITDEQKTKLLSLLGINSESDEWAVDLSLRLEAS